MDINLIPQPVSLTRREGVFNLSADCIVTAGENALDTAALVQDLLAESCGARPALNPAWVKKGAAGFDLRLDPSLQELGKEGYRLSVAPGQVTLRAAAAPGLFYAFQTLRQLIPTQDECSIPCLEIEDKPRFAWRGAMMDSCRHFVPLNGVFRFIDLLARHKLNSFHWHLTDDQGWRIEIQRYPKLTEIGGWRRDTLVGHYNDNTERARYDGIPHGGFYTQAEIKRVVAYAAARHITVVPEIEMPGHAQAAVAAYPELGNHPDVPVEVSRTWGIHFDVYNAEESTLRFMQNVLDEVLDLFPSEFIHIGGDECPKKQWHESAAAQARMRALGLKDEEELQSYFVRRMDAFLFARGRRLIGWDEILEGGLAPRAAVMSWRGEEGGITAANAGHDVVMAPTTYTYLDYYQVADQAAEPLTIGGFLPLEKVYGYDPIPDAIPADKAHHVLGAQGQLWAEYIDTQDKLDHMMFPRLCALAEVVWTPKERKDYAGFLARLRGGHLARLDALGVKYRKLDPDA
jgi:hexosaminidase